MLHDPKTASNLIQPIRPNESWNDYEFFSDLKLFSKVVARRGLNQPNHDLVRKFWAD